MRSWLKECTAHTMSVAEAAWLAGFVDGEGSVVRYVIRKRYPGWMLIISNTDYDALEYCLKITGAGHIYEKPTKPAHKTQYVWELAAQRDTAAVLKQIAPYLRIKRVKAEAFLDEWKDLDGA